MPLSRRHLFGWSIAALILMAVGTTALEVGRQIRARTEHRRAIFTIHEMISHADGTIWMRSEKAVVGDNLRAGLARKIGSDVFVYEETSKGGSGIREWLGFAPMIGDDSPGIGEGSFGLGDCPQPEMITTPLRIELKPGERYVLAICRDKSGATAELYLFCEIN